MNIFSCKLYKSSKHKDKIRAAASDPINKELLEQAVEYLDDEYLDEEYLGPAKDSEEKSEQAEDSELRPSEGSGMSGGGGGSFSEGFESVEGEEPDNDHELSDRLAEEEGEEPAEDVGESTQVKKSPVMASVDDIAKDIDVLSGTLNSEESTQGVARVVIKNECELWIHYKDNINLNNVMEAVISKISTLGYNNLEFNRLARTDNAIVFTINEVSTADSSESSEKD